MQKYRERIAEALRFPIIELDQLNTWSEERVKIHQTIVYGFLHHFLIPNSPVLTFPSRKSHCYQEKRGLNIRKLMPIPFLFKALGI